MSDDTTLAVGVGGDVIRTDSLISETTGLEFAKAQAVKLITGRNGLDGGFVCRENPLPVTDADVVRRLDTIVAQLDRILKALETDTL